MATQSEIARAQSNVGFPTQNFSVGDVLDGIKSVGQSIGGAIVTGGKAVGSVLGDVVRGGAQVIRDPQVVATLGTLVQGSFQQKAQESIAKEQRRAAEAVDAANRSSLVAQAQAGVLRDYGGQIRAVETPQGTAYVDQYGNILSAPGGGSGAGGSAPFYSDFLPSGSDNSMLLWIAAAGLGIYFLSQRN